MRPDVLSALRGLGSRARERPILALLAAVLAVDYADRSALGAVGPQLKSQFGIDNAELGLAASAFALVGGLATIPAGILADRTRRTRIVAVATAVWSLAMLAGGLAFSFAILLGSRILLGVASATPNPTAASVVGDLYQPVRRGQALGVVSSGELVGTGFGVVTAATFGLWLSWRAPFLALAALGVVLSLLMWRRPEPPRREARLEDRRVSIVQAFRRVLGKRTVVIVLAASAIAYSFFAGVRTFAVTFAVRRYDVSEPVGDLLLVLVGLGALLGIVIGGSLADKLTSGGRGRERLTLAAVGYGVAALCYTPALLSGSLPASLPLYVLGSVALTLAIPALNAVRLDVVAPELWGRAESVRTTVQIALEAIGPLLFGLVADTFGNGHGQGLELAFLCSLPLLVVSGLVLLLGRPVFDREATKEPHA